MLTLRIDNSTCQFSGLSVQDMKQLRDLMSYTVENPMGVDYRKPLIDRRGSFPTGLLYIAKAWVAKTRCQVVYNDTRTPPNPRHGLFKMSLAHTPYPEQLEAATALAGASRGIVSAPTGSGKSVIIALLIDKLQVPTLVVVPTLELKRQLTESLREAFGAEQVGTLGGGRPVVVENVDALDPKVVLRGYDAVIVDELHHVAANTYQKLNRKSWVNVFYRFGLTATPFRSNDNERLLFESFLSQVVYKIDYQTCVDKGYIVPLEAYYYELPRVEVRGDQWREVYNELVVHRQDRNELIQGLLDQLGLAGVSALCLVKEIAHGEKFSSHYFAHGVNEDTPHLIKMFNIGKLPVLTGTTGVLGEGVDTKPCEYVIIAGLGKSKPAFMQQCGRGFRRYGDKTSCKIIIFKDLSHRWTKAHFAAQCKILRDEYGVIPVKIG